MTRRKRITRRLSAATLLGLALIFLAACTQGEEDFRTSEEVTLQVAAIPNEVTEVTLEVNGTTYDVPLSTGTVTLTNLPLKSTVFTARGLGAKGIVLYKIAKPITITADTDTVELEMNRLTSDVKVNLTGAVTGETLKASVGGVAQALDASRTLTGVKTGAGLTLLVEGSVGDTLKRQGSVTFDLSEADASVNVTLTALGVDNVAPNAPRLSVPADITEGEAFTLNVTASDADGNLASIKVEWGDGSDASTTFVSGNDADEDFAHTYMSAGAQTITVTVTDAKGVSAQVSQSVTVKAVETPDDETDVNIGTGKEVRLVTVTATDVPAGTAAIQATVTDEEGAKKVLGLVKNGATWRGSTELLNSTAYSVVLDYDGTKSDAKSFTLDDSTDDFSVSVSLGATTSTNRAPVATPDLVDLLTNDGTWSFNTIANDTDPDGDTLTIVSFTQPDLNSGGLTLEGNTFTYEVPTQVGETSFTYVISDGNGGTATGQVTMVIDLGIPLGG